MLSAIVSLAKYRPHLGDSTAGAAAGGDQPSLPGHQDGMEGAVVGEEGEEVAGLVRLHNEALGLLSVVHGLGPKVATAIRDSWNLATPLLFQRQMASTMTLEVPLPPLNCQLIIGFSLSSFVEHARLCCADACAISPLQTAGSGAVLAMPLFSMRCFFAGE